jgi:hypothetical protein
MDTQNGCETMAERKVFRDTSTSTSNSNSNSNTQQSKSNGINHIVYNILNKSLKNSIV